MTPTLGRIVIYTLSEEDVKQINRRRTNGASIAARISDDRWPLGAQAHIGNDVKEGQEFPMIVACVNSESNVNGQVFLDGNDQLWVTSAIQGTGPRTWIWPPRV